MKFHYKVIDSLPPLAWLAEVHGGQAEVLCGSAVETRDTCFVSGAWDGDFDVGRFLSADLFCGTGAQLTDDVITFSTPTHVISGLFGLQTANSFIISNSLCFLLAHCGETLDPQYAAYERDFNTIMDGINHCCTKLRLASDRHVEIYYFRTVSISDTGVLTVTVKPPVRPFQSFEDYYARLSEAINRLAANAADPARTVSYGMVTTVSRGYDAPCCAAVARQAGCETAVTFCAEGKYAEDSGVEVARALGYKTILERDAQTYRQRTDLVEAYYLCAGELGSQISFSAFDDDFRGNLVFTGNRGDWVWSYSKPFCNDEFRFDDIHNQLGISEPILWLRTILVPMPLYGASAWTSLQKISQSEQMRPWSLGNGYDRPIPRRICEQAGVKRELFGMVKRGAGFTYRYDWLHRIFKHMSPASAEDFTRYLRAHAKHHPGQVISYFWKMRAVYLHRYGLPVRLPDSREVSHCVNPTAVRYLIPWAADTICKRYTDILENIDR